MRDATSAEAGRGLLPSAPAPPGQAAGSRGTCGSISRDTRARRQLVPIQSVVHNDRHGAHAFARVPQKASPRPYMGRKVRRARAEPS